MKKQTLLLTFVVIIFTTFAACSKKEYMNVLYFTDNLNSQTEGYDVKMSDYYVKDNIYTLPVKSENETVIMRLVTDENGDIGEIRVTLAKTDEKGKRQQISQQHRQLYNDTVRRMLRAFTYCDEETAGMISESMKLSESAPFTSTGEITSRMDNYYFIVFSTDFSVSFTVKNIHISPVEKTEKPESRPAFGNTTNIRTETVPLR